MVLEAGFRDLKTRPGAKKASRLPELVPGEGESGRDQESECVMEGVTVFAVGGGEQATVHMKDFTVSPLQCESQGSRDSDIFPDASYMVCAQ